MLKIDLKTGSAERWEVSTFLLNANSIKTWKTLHLNQCYTQNLNVNGLIWETAFLDSILSTVWEVSWCISGSEVQYGENTESKRENHSKQSWGGGLTRSRLRRALLAILRILVFILEQWKSVKNSTKWNAMSRVAVRKDHSDCRVESCLEQD